MIRFFCPGIPKSMSVGKSFSFRRKGGPVQHVQKRNNTEWGLLVGQVGRQYAPAVPLDGALIVTAEFWLPRPMSLPKREAFTALPTRRPDLDNLFHKLMDSWNGVFWHDDSQVTDIVLRKRYPRDGRTGVEIIVASALSVFFHDKEA